MIKQIPNILTFGRLVLTFVVLVMILYEPHVSNKSMFLDITFVLFVISGLTDVFDGYAARKLKVASKFGRMLDPFVDKVLVCGAFICFAIIGEPKLFDLDNATLSVIHWLVVAVLIAREAYVTILRQIAEAKGINFAATWSGKVKMFFQSFAIGTVLIKIAHFEDAAWANWFTIVTLTIMIAATVYSGFRATRRKSWQEVKNTA